MVTACLIIGTALPFVLYFLLYRGYAYSIVYCVEAMRTLRESLVVAGLILSVCVVYACVVFIVCLMMAGAPWCLA